jgi:hypothetical protein
MIDMENVSDKELEKIEDQFHDLRDDSERVWAGRIPAKSSCCPTGSRLSGKWVDLIN